MSLFRKSSGKTEQLATVILALSPEFPVKMVPSIRKQVSRRGRRLFLPLLLAALLQTAGVAQTAAPPSAGTEALRPETEKGGRPDEFDIVRFTNQSASHYYYNQVTSPPSPDHVFFPPVPPPLESEIRLLPPMPAGVPAPPELAAFVGELFYPALGARLAEDDLPRALQAQLQAYRTAKITLQNQLRSRIDELKDSDPATRERQLAALAEAQSAGILELEATAERIRAALRRSGVFGLPPGPGDWTENPAWRLHDAGHIRTVALGDRQLDSAGLRGAAYFQEGLSPAQRRLLCEAAVEAGTGADPNPPAGRPAQGGWLLYFSPETASVRLPADLPETLVNRINAYISTKAKLKAALRETLHTYADSTGGARAEALRQLAAVQTPRFASLEAAAEEIRRDIAALPNQPGPPAPPSLPPELTARISSYRTHKIEVLTTLSAMLAVPSKAAGPTTLDGDPSGPAGTRDGAAPIRLKPDDLRMSVEEFNRRQNALVDGLNQELAGIREALANYVRTTNQPTDPKSINDLLKDFEKARQQREILSKYTDYQAAVLLPGLSPEQRRLLFDAAIEHLALPLPAAETVE